MSWPATAALPRHPWHMKRTSTCTICGLPAPRGARLCTPCRAALKRAAQHTVQDYPHYRAPVPRAHAPRPEPLVVGHADRTAARRTRRERADAGRRVVLAAAALAALAGVAYLGQPQWDDAEDGTAGGERHAGDHRPPSATRPSTDDAHDPPLAPMASPATVPATATAGPPGAHPAPTAGSLPRKPARAVPAPRRTDQPATPAPAYPPLDAFGAIAEAPRAPPPPAAAPRATPPPDRWERMTDALAQCEREGGLSGFLCDQRVRIDACDGYWGRVPQCPAMPENPR
ncbi:MAG: hypothetical protein U1F58_03530 [Burkholderiales bacterium]